MSNRVEVDAQVLNAEVDRIVGGIPPDAAPGPTPEELEAQQQAQQAQFEEDRAKVAAARYLLGTRAAVEGIARVVMPNWNLQDDEKAVLAAELATAMGWWFPSISIHPKWLALVGVGSAVYAIAQSRKDPATGKVKPMRVRPVNEAEGEQKQTEADAPEPA